MAVNAPQLEWVKPPRQARSLETLERILDAAEALIIEKGASALTIAEVARRARSSVGSLYARFSGKEALLRSVFERFFEQAAATAEKALDPGVWQTASLAAVFEQICAFTVRTFVERRELIASLTIYAAQSPEMSAIAERLGDTLSERFHALLVARGARFTHPDPARAIQLTTWMLLSAMEAHTLHGASNALSSDFIAREAARMFSAYLGIDQASIDPAPTNAPDEH